MIRSQKLRLQIQVLKTHLHPEMLAPPASLDLRMVDRPKNRNAASRHGSLPHFRATGQLSRRHRPREHHPVSGVLDLMHRQIVPRTRPDREGDAQ